MTPPFGFYFNDSCSTTSNLDDKSLLAYQHAELIRQNLELTADIDCIMGSNAVAQSNSLLQQRRKQCLVSKKGKPSAVANANIVSRTASCATAVSYTSEGRFDTEADETPKNRLSSARRRVIHGKTKANEDADGMSHSASMTTSAGYATEATCEPDETPPSTSSRASRRVTFADEVDVSPGTDSEKVRKVRFLLPEAAEEKHRDAFEAKENEETKSAPHTAVMMRNIPQEYTRAKLIELLDQQGFNGLYELVYVPTAMDTELSYCYAFITLTTEGSVDQFLNHFIGFKDWSVPSDKVCEVRFNDMLRNTEEHIQRYRDSTMMHESVEDRFKPALFENGQRVPFPEPTKLIRAPKRRNKSACASKADEQVA
jgi:hypothetical protein